jgi:hypothetical protein
MARDQQRANIKSAYAACRLIASENCPAEERLEDPHRGSNAPLRRSRGPGDDRLVLRCRLGLRTPGPRQGRRKHFKQLRALFDEILPSIVEFVPNLPRGSAGVRQAGDSLVGEQRIERTEIAEFPGNGCWRPSDQLCEADDLGVIGFCLRKWDLAIQIERENRLISRPAIAISVSCHCPYKSTRGRGGAPYPHYDESPAIETRDAAVSMPHFGTQAANLFRRWAEDWQGTGVGFQHDSGGKTSEAWAHRQNLCSDTDQATCVFRQGFLLSDVWPLPGGH